MGQRDSHFDSGNVHSRLAVVIVSLESCLLSPFKSARRLKPADALHDVIAGSTLAAVNIP